MTNYKNQIENKTKEFLENSLTETFVTRAYSNISFSPEQRAITERESFKTNIDNAFNELLPLATDEEKQTIFKDMFDKFFTGYSKRYIARLQTLSNCFSTMITGGGNVDTNKHQKMNDREHKKSQDQSSYYEYMTDKIKKALNKQEKETVETLEVKLKELIELHKLSLALNKVARKKIDNEAKIKECQELTSSTEMLKSFIWNLNNKSQFFTTNSNNRIKTLKAKIEMKTYENKENITKEYEFFTLVVNYELNRYQVLFSDIPPAEDRDFLKSNGFRWSGKNKAWQQYLTSNGKYKITLLIQHLKDKNSESN